MTKTEKTIRRIAELKIKTFNLNCTVDEYIKKNTVGFPAFASKVMEDALVNYSKARN